MILALCTAEFEVVETKSEILFVFDKCVKWYEGHRPPMYGPHKSHRSFGLCESVRLSMIQKTIAENFLRKYFPVSKNFKTSFLPSDFATIWMNDTNAKHTSDCAGAFLKHRFPMWLQIWEPVAFPPRGKWHYEVNAARNEWTSMDNV